MATTELVREFPCDADTLWRTVGSFRRYEWGAGVEPGVIEDGRPDNEIGTVRAFRYYGSPARQRLTAHDDSARALSWESLEPYEDIRHYVQSIAVEPLGAGRAALTWSVEFDTPEESVDQWSAFFRGEFAASFDKLDGILSAAAR